MTENAALLDVLNGRKPARRPIWLMRQAGRYLPEYRKVREQAGSFLKLCYSPELAAEVTLQPLWRYDLDAAILFADILVVPHAMGVSLDFVENEGPVLSTVHDMAGVKALSSAVGSVEFGKICETLHILKKELPSKIGLIGFCGAPWTVASYMIEGRGSDRKKAIAAAVENPGWFSALIERLVDVSSNYLLAQIEAGAQVVQIFDSWAGDVPALCRQRVVEVPIRQMIERIRARYPGFPVIVFARGFGADHAAVAAATGASAVSVEQGVDLAALLRDLPASAALQGNLAPEVLLQGDAAVRDGVKSVVSMVPMGRHIFNLGHGIVPQVKPETVNVLVDAVRSFDRENG